MQKQESPTYLKAITIRDPSDIHTIKEDIKKHMILILRVTPLAQKDVDKLRKLVEELYSVAKNAEADIARLGEERIIVAPSSVKIWKPEYDLK
ncbi:MAG: cell division protein SepF [Nitrosopumilaceae archaeon]|nr:cell division protein SepF [Nitrosopumilaceae archaeon]NIU00815.1 cell division protein SepF [Nitrosopumilaceae archaeon]NIU87268.1 cell division protein SepF [Nitrosopumilaceae archaeon]NIV65796.1 cell division protein SepF [Nitrosopumilaceae archaeon]NIX61417.1 cell division protein SepF [Nitrosopumilaceae archaeon]